MPVSSELPKLVLTTARLVLEIWPTFVLQLLKGCENYKELLLKKNEKEAVRKERRFSGFNGLNESFSRILLIPALHLSLLFFRFLANPPVLCDTANRWEQFGSNCYKLHHTLRKSWVSARSECLKEGADLVSVGSAEEELYVLGLDSSFYDLWLGYSTLVSLSLLTTPLPPPKNPHILSISECVRSVYLYMQRLLIVKMIVTGPSVCSLLLQQKWIYVAVNISFVCFFFYLKTRIVFFFLIYVHSFLQKCMSVSCQVQPNSTTFSWSDAATFSYTHWANQQPDLT